MNLSQVEIAKELSWLSFNERVLQEAADPRNPLIERVRFLGIFSSNQDEFFKVRVANLRRLSIHESKQGGGEAFKLMKEVQKKVRGLSNEFDRIYGEMEIELTKRKIFFLSEGQLSEKQSAWLREQFRDKIMRHIVPILVSNKKRLEDSLEAEVSYLIVQIKRAEEVSYAVIDLPQSVPRILNVPPDRGHARNYFMMMDEVIRHNLDQIFTPFFDFDSLEAWSMKFSRDSEYILGDDPEVGLLRRMSQSMKQRMRAEPMRLSYDRNMPPEMVEMLLQQIGIEDIDAVIPGGRYRNFRDFIGFPNPIGPHLEYQRLPAIQNQQFLRHRNVFDAIDESDILLLYPYHRFSHFTEFVRQAAFDPQVTAIKINIYRAASNSRVAESLIDAARNGKHVSVNIELRARFDEQHNLQMTEKFVDAGIKVTFGIPSLKVHSKLCIVARQIEGKERLYACISTGNFNEKTAKVYTDFALFTARQTLCREAREVFTFIDYSYRQPRLKYLMVSPINTRTGLERRIEREIAHVAQGRPGLIRVKLNNLVDDHFVRLLCEASQAGVKIEMLIRGMCTLKPGVKGISENIRIISIVDRFLEHSRVIHFHNNGDDEVYISSADWMTRNLDERVEVTCPILDEVLRARMLAILDLQLKENHKARVLDATQSNSYVSRGNRRKVHSQLQVYEMLKHFEANPS